MLGAARSGLLGAAGRGGGGAGGGGGYTIPITDGLVAWFDTADAAESLDVETLRLSDVSGNGYYFDPVLFYGGLIGTNIKRSDTYGGCLEFVGSKARLDGAIPLPKDITVGQCSIYTSPQYCFNTCRYGNGFMLTTPNSTSNQADAYIANSTGTQTRIIRNADNTGNYLPVVTANTPYHQVLSCGSGVANEIKSVLYGTGGAIGTQYAFSTVVRSDQVSRVVTLHGDTAITSRLLRGFLFVFYVYNRVLSSEEKDIINSFIMQRFV